MARAIRHGFENKESGKILLFVNRKKQKNLLN